MLSYLGRVFRAMLASSLGLGGGVALLVLIFVLTNKNEPNAWQYALWAGSGIGLIFMVFLVAVFIPLDLSAHVLLPKGRYKQIWVLEQVREFEVDGTAKEMMHASRQALLVVPYVTAVSDDMENMLTRGVTGTSWRSPGGEELEVEVNPLGENHWKIRATSKPKGKGVLFDYGKNFENLETWMNTFIQTVQADGKSRNIKLMTTQKNEIIAAEPEVEKGTKAEKAKPDKADS